MKKDNKLKIITLALISSGLSQTFFPIMASASDKIPNIFPFGNFQISEGNEEDSSCILSENGMLIPKYDLDGLLSQEFFPYQSENLDQKLEIQTDPVFIAIQQGNLDGIMGIILEDHNVIKKRDKKFRTPLLFAFQINVEFALAILNGINQMCEPDDVLDMLSAVDIDGTSIMHLVAQSDDLVSFANYLLNFSEGKFLSSKDHNGKTPLHFAVESNSPEMISFLCEVSNGNLISSVDQNGMTPLHYAAISNKVETFDFLLNFTAKDSNEVINRLKYKDKNGATLVHCAALNNSTEVLEYLWSLNFNEGELFITKDANMKTPLHYAAQGGANNAILFLLEKFQELNVFPLEIDIKKHSPLHYAIKSNDVEAVGVFLSLIIGENFNPTCSLDRKGMTILHYAVKHGSLDVMLEILKLFSENGVDNFNSIEDKKGRNIFFYVKEDCMVPIDDEKLPLAIWLISTGIIHPEMPDSKGRYIIHYAVFGGKFQILNWLVENGMSISLPDSEGRTPFFYALKANNEDMIKLFLENYDKDTLDTTTVDGKNSLFYAVDNGSKDLVQFLVEGGISASPEITNSDGMNLLHYSAYHGKLDTTAYLLQCWREVLGENEAAYLQAINARDSKGVTPLLYASQNNFLNLICLLVDNGADCNIGDAEGRTCLHYATKSASYELVKFFLENGANPNYKDLNGKTPMHYAEDSQLVKLLLKSGANPDEVDKNLRTPLFDAIEEGRLDVVIFLITTCNVDVDHEDSRGNTPLFIAAKTNSLISVKLLLEERATLETENEEGRTPEEVAELNGSVDVLEFFKSAREE